MHDVAGQRPLTCKRPRLGFAAREQDAAVHLHQQPDQDVRLVHGARSSDLRIAMLSKPKPESVQNLTAALLAEKTFENDVRGPLSVGMNALLLDRSGLSNYFARIKTLKELLALV